MNKLFRTLIIINIILYVAYYFTPYFDYLWLSEEELTFVSYNGLYAIIQLPNFIWHIIMISWIVSAIGMFFYLNIARNAFIVLLVLTTLLTPFTGLLSISHIDAFLLAILNTIDGALVVLMLFTSVSESFTNSPNKKAIGSSIT